MTLYQIFKNLMNNIKVWEYIRDKIENLKIKEQFSRQIEKIKIWTFDKGLWFEKITTNSWKFFYSFRINIHFRGYARKENDILIIFDVNNHNYKEIISKMKKL